MNIPKILRFAFVLAAVLCMSLTVSAQRVYQLAGKPDLKVSGGSTLHDWEMVSTTASGKAEITVDDQGIEAIKLGEVTMKVNTLKSGKGQMDDIAYKALKADKNPNIHFKLTSFKNLGGNKATITGDLTIAGTTKPVTFQVQTMAKGDVIEIKGDTSFKMTDFNVSPPTAMFGTVKTEDKVRISFKANFKLLNS
ncbi:YceI family protein [Pontibacter cellulosilyticus]|uniref:YceI family protein n=1 Tax=Pontibacter cellulosilyticus TaxID=1720253 RepID=A0A923SJ75_9BACT|nr:YceI family protein [Pontibacter cellulosilyticus]MBC5993518.1 YceI family protein [Pontibacter cellulosilyticus]